MILGLVITFNLDDDVLVELDALGGLTLIAFWQDLVPITAIHETQLLDRGFDLRARQLNYAYCLTFTWAWFAYVLAGMRTRFSEFARDLCLLKTMPRVTVRSRIVGVIFALGICGLIGFGAIEVNFLEDGSWLSGYQIGELAIKFWMYPLFVCAYLVFIRYLGSNTIIAFNLKRGYLRPLGVSCRMGHQVHAFGEDGDCRCDAGFYGVAVGDVDGDGQVQR